MDIKVYNDNFYNEELTEFRRKVIFEDCENFNDKCLYDTNYKYSNMVNKNHKTFEDGYRFTASKFFKTKFHHIVCALHNQEVYSFSGAVDHNDYLKVAIYHYSLKKYRKIRELRSPLWRSEGFLDKHIHIANGLNKDALFFTIYNYNNSLKYFIENFKKKNKRHDKYYRLENLQLPQYQGEITYNNVRQSLFTIKLKEDFKVKNLIKEIDGYI